MSNPIVALGAVVASFTAVILWMFFAFLASSLRSHANATPAEPTEA